jgi:putative ubiquitin-RnfH superfamily antitoxin RatB of RatAB toxin-antitoxin module
VLLRIEVVFAGEGRQLIKAYRLQAPASVADALCLAAAEPDFAALDGANAPVGIFGRVVARTQMLADGDRVEIYRPLTVDPKTARRSRARRGR